MLSKSQTLQKKMRIASRENHERPKDGQTKIDLPIIKTTKSLSSLPTPSTSELSPVRPVRTQNQFHRLSGLYDFMDSSGLLPSNSILTKPVAVCVRCANHASICMPCAELLCDQSLTFYRMSRAKGAAALFSQAIHEAGLGKLVKFCVFKLWCNSHSQRKRVMNKKRTVVERLFGGSIVHMPFIAWARYTRENKVARKENIIIDLSEKVKFLEQQVTKFTSENSFLTKQVNDLKTELGTLKPIIATQTEGLKRLHDEISLERSRVVGLCAMTEPLHVMNSIINDIIKSTQSGVRKSLLTKTVSGHYYNHLYSDSPNELYEQCAVNSEDGIDEGLDVLVELAERDTQANPTPSSSTTRVNMTALVNPTHRIMFRWMEAKSKEVSMRVEPSTGENLDDYVPSAMLQNGTTTIESVGDLADGKMLARVVIGLIYDAADSLPTESRAHKGHTHKPSSVMLSPNASLADALTQAISTFDHSVLEEMRAVCHDDHALLPLVIRFAHTYLGTPMFKFRDIFLGDKDTTIAFVAHLMLVASPTKPLANAHHVASLASEFENNRRVLSEVKELSAVCIDKLGLVQDMWAAKVQAPVVRRVVMPWADDESLASLNSVEVDDGSVASRISVDVISSDHGIDNAAQPAAQNPAEFSEPPPPVPSSQPSVSEQSSESVRAAAAAAAAATTAAAAAAAAATAAAAAAAYPHLSKEIAALMEPVVDDKYANLIAAVDDFLQHLTASPKSLDRGGSSSGGGGGGGGGASSEEAQQQTSTAEDVGERENGADISQLDADEGEGAPKKALCLTAAVHQLASTALSSLHLRSSVNRWNDHNDEGMRLGTDLHRQVSSVLIHGMSEKLHWVAAESVLLTGKAAVRQNIQL